MPVAGQAQAAPSAADERGVHYKWIALSNTTLGILMVTINQSILLISLPALFRGIKLNPLVPSNTSYFLWVFMGFLLVTAVLVVSLGRVGDIYGRVKMYNLGFAIFTLFSILLSVTWLTGVPGALWIIIMRVFQGVGGAFLFANSTAILTDAFPQNERGKAMGINGIAAVGGSFLGLILGGVLAPIEWRLVFLVSVPFGLFGTVWAYLKLADNGIRIPAKIDWLGNALFAVGLIALLTGIVYSLLPYGGHPTGWTNPWVLTAIFGGIAILILFAWVETKVAQPMFRLGLFKIRAFTAGQHRRPARRPRPRRHPVHADHLAAGHLAAAARLQLQPDAAVGGHRHGPADDRVPHRRAAGRARCPTATAPRLFATAGLIVSGAAFLLLELLPINFSYIWFALLIFLFAVGMGLFFSPNQAAVMNSLPRGPARRGRRHAQHVPELGHRAVHGPVLHHRHARPGRPTCPRHLYKGLVNAGVAPSAAHLVANEPPIGSLFSAFLGYNPIKELLGPTGALQHLSPQPAGVRHRPLVLPQADRAAVRQRPAPGLHLRRHRDGRGHRRLGPARASATCTRPSRRATSWPTAPPRSAGSRASSSRSRPQTPTSRPTAPAATAPATAEATAGGPRPSSRGGSDCAREAAHPEAADLTWRATAHRGAAAPAAGRRRRRRVSPCWASAPRPSGPGCPSGPCATTSSWACSSRPARRAGCAGTPRRTWPGWPASASCRPCSA